MIVDTSAVICVLREEPESERFLELMSAFPTRMSAGSYLETSVVVDANRDPVLSRRLDQLLLALEVTVEPVTVDQVRLARMAYRDFGRGTGHPARLNFGDCFAYALAASTGEPLLFKGADFAETDLRPAITD